MIKVCERSSSNNRTHSANSMKGHQRTPTLRREDNQHLKGLNLKVIVCVEGKLCQQSLLPITNVTHPFLHHLSYDFHLLVMLVVYTITFKIFVLTFFCLPPLHHFPTAIKNPIKIIVHQQLCSLLLRRHTPFKGQTLAKRKHRQDK